MNNLYFCINNSALFSVFPLERESELPLGDIAANAVPKAPGFTVSLT